MTLPVAILAGGLATRLRPITETIPKSLVVLAGKPFVFHQLSLLEKQGVRRVVLCVGHLGEQVVAAVGDGAAFGLHVDYSFDGPMLLGTAGALKAALPKLGPAFFVLYGDSYLRCSFADVETAFIAAAKPALMTVLRNEGRWDATNVLFEYGQLLRYDKRNPTTNMRHVDYGLSIVTRGVLAGCTAGERCDLGDLLGALSSTGELAGYEVRERFYEIGSPAGLAETEELLSLTRQP